MKTGTVFLVGAGPGNPMLMTRQAVECLENADAVVYDALAGSSLLNVTKPECELIYAGKTAGNHFRKQSEINNMLAELAIQGKQVVRLKGGDPFVFGRGGEEVSLLKERNIPYCIVSGVSSCYSVPAYAGIPVTHRDYSSSFHVITGHRKSESDLQCDYEKLAQLDGTLVFLMSLKNLDEISSMLIRYGKSPDTPSAVIQQGTSSHQKTAVSTLADICDEVRRCGIKTPALTVIGDVVSLREDLKWFERGKLFGKKILLTGTPAYVEKASEKLRRYGAETAEISLIYPSAEMERLENICWNKYSWLVLTSANGVDILFEQLYRLKIDLRNLMHMKFAVIGTGTAEALAKKGIKADCIPEIFNSQSLAEILIPQLSDSDRVLVLCAENGSEILPAMLEKSGMKFDRIPFYSVRTEHRKKHILQTELENSDYVFLASSSASRAFAQMTADMEKPYSAKIVSIGNATSHTAENLGISVNVTAEKSDIDGMIDCILKRED